MTTEITVAGSRAPDHSHVPVRIPHGVLDVLDGVHRGASIALDKTTISLGSTPDADITLSDAGVAQRHGIVRLQDNIVVIEATGADIAIGPKNHRIPRGHGCRARLPVALRLGDAVIRLAAPHGAAPPHPRGPLRRWGALGAACAVALLATFHLGNDSFAWIGRTSPAQTAAAAPQAASAAMTGAAAVHVAPTEAVEKLRADLGAAGLTEVAAQLDGNRVVVSGTVSDDQRKAWSQIQRSFDRDHGGRLVLASTVEARKPETNPKFDLQAVSFGETPYVITGDGQRRYPGAVLDRGWVIKEIRESGLKLSKDGREMVLTF